MQVSPSLPHARETATLPVFLQQNVQYQLSVLKHFYTLLGFDGQRWAGVYYTEVLGISRSGLPCPQTMKAIKYVLIGLLFRAILWPWCVLVFFSKEQQNQYVFSSLLLLKCNIE